MEARFTAFNQQHQLWHADDRVGLAVSGGMDSMVMLHLFIKAGIPVTVLHVNFQLRGAASDQDEAFVTNVSARHLLPCRVHRVDTKLYASNHRLSVQEAARALRYAWFRQLLTTEFTKIGTAHHLNDAAETFFINLIRGTGIAGLAGIPLRQNGIVRPLLFASREEIENYAAVEQITWREDASNLTDDYRRNRLRHHLLPLVQEFNPSWLEAFGQTQARLRVAADFLQRGIARWKATWGGGQHALHIPISEVTAFAEPAASLWEAVKDYGFAMVVCEQLIQSLRKPQAGKRFESATHQLWVDREMLILSEKTELPQTAVWIAEVEGAYPGKQGTITTHFGTASLSSDKNTAHFDLDRIQFPVLWRAWKPGDRFRPLGVGGFKKVSDFLIDEKVPMSDKPFVTVLESAGDLIWVVGHRVDDRFKITETTRRQIVFRWTP